MLQFLFVNTRTIDAVALNIFRVLDGGGRGDKSTIDTTDERVGSQTIRTVNRVVAFAGREQSGKIRSLVVVNPKSTHRIMHARKDAHRYMTRIVAYKHFVDFENRAQLSIETFRGIVG